jgi:putative sugar O-methyltransferase
LHLNQIDRSVFRPSPFWEGLGRRHSEELERFGFENFKRTVNLRYFNWGVFGLFAHQFIPLATDWLRSPNPRVFTASVVNNGDGPSELALGRLSARAYAILCALLFASVRRRDSEGFLEKYVEPMYGNPFVVRAFDCEFTQDACNSVHESYSATIELPELSTKTIIEIGAGYGRLAHLLLTMRPGVKYWIVDVKPAIDVSQEYLKKTLPNKRIFGSQSFSNFEDVRAQVMASDLSFFMADQIVLLPAKCADLVVCISNLHEMTREQIDFYYDEVDRLCRGYFYSKQWMKSVAKENGFIICREEYPTKPSWREVFNHRHDVQSWFFHSLHEIGSRLE